ncbi:YdbC family protein [Sediminibacillus halophilus]|uniref:DUF4937 domain-containing protein n=1 Tax=Sediminibacillus halophilus TaxID=482461 RepID=A0A1G9NN45_9BACI|nr:YdbC family protein [Sediminibacillus halophilus]SDL87774.1 protein of unknown function [Sediminibacillus halophilus]
MIIKKISCHVPPEAKQVFSEQQAMWNALKQCNGFLGQFGGWEETNSYTASIYSFWETLDDYRHFMEHTHDSIVEGTNQQKTYNSISIDLFERQFNLSEERDIYNVLEKAHFVRIALATVKCEFIPRFIYFQQGIWNPGMQQAEGMLGGVFARSREVENQFLVLSGWKSAYDHRQYMQSFFPSLLEAANPKRDVSFLVGEQFSIQETWRVSR